MSPESKQSNVETVEIPFVGKAYKEFSLSYDAQTCENFYLVMDSTGKTPKALMPTPGLTLFASVAANNVRGLYSNNGTVYCVAGNKLFNISNTGTVTTLGTLNSSIGPVWWAANDQGGVVTQILIVDGNDGYVWKPIANTFEEITDANFFDAATCAFLNGFALVNNPGLNQGQVSVAEDFTTWGFGDPEEANLFGLSSFSEKIIAIKSFKLELYMFTSKGAEVWVPSANTTLPFQRRDDVLITQGLAAAASIAEADNTIYWLSSTGYGQGAAVYAFYDITQQRVSDPAFELETQSYVRIDDAIGYSMMWKGNIFYVLIFPSANVTWFYNIATKSWQKLLSENTNSEIQSLTSRHLSNCYCYAYGKNLVGDYSSGNIYYFDDTNYTDNGLTIYRERATEHLFQQDRMIFITNFVIVFEAGVGLLAGQGSNPQVMLQFSNDGGRTWSEELWRSVGAFGLYRWRAVWERLGGARDWVFRLRVSDPIKTVIIGAYANIEVGDF